MRSSSARSKKRASPVFPLREALADRNLVGGTVLDCVIKNGWIRGQPSHRQFVDVAFECATVQKVARDIVEPEALAQIVQELVGFHILRIRHAYEILRRAKTGSFTPTRIKPKRSDAPNSAAIT